MTATVTEVWITQSSLACWNNNRTTGQITLPVVTAPVKQMRSCSINNSSGRRRRDRKRKLDL